MQAKPEPLAVPDPPYLCWSVGFMLDQLSDGRSVRLFNVFDDCMYRGGFFLACLTGQTGTGASDRMARQTRSDNGPE